jgi:DNA-nicking Smr family endonuclease
VRLPRGLTPDEAALWRRIAATVTPLRPERAAAAPVVIAAPPPTQSPKRIKARVPAPLPPPSPPARPAHTFAAGGLDASWERKLARGATAPDRTIDLHGLSLDGAHGALNAAIGAALASGARVVLVITGHPRPHGEHDARGHRRGAIRAKLLDWLAAGPHASRIAAVRPAQPRHGGTGAVYVVLRRG